MSLILRYGVSYRTRRNRAEVVGQEFDRLFQGHAWGHSVLPQEAVRLYNVSKIVLGINHYLDPGFTDLWGLHYSKIRDFEVPMSGGCLLTQYTPELEDFYPDPGLIEMYSSIEELCEKADALRKDSKRRSTMRQNARKFSLQHHTWQHRFERLFKELRLSEG